MKKIDIKDKYNALRELKFEKLKHKYSCLFENFQTYQTELKNFLLEDATRNQEMCISTTYLIFDYRDFRYNKKTPSQLTLLGYVTITNDSINLNRELKNEFESKCINYKSLPSLKIGRLCVDERYERKNIGTLIVTFCIKKACSFNKEIACRFITLDAKRHSDKKKDS